MFAGHNKGVQVVEFFPGTGHLIMSASLDGKVKVRVSTSHAPQLGLHAQHTVQVHTPRARAIMVPTCG
ncbi:hypothetical protein EON66_03355 [archaeon]|nr:MAG: hypothetical protein EON66_03355 [archaeon]